MAIAVKLDDLLHDRRMTLTELAERVGLTLANLSILKTGKARAIRFSTLDAICEELWCQPGDILQFESERSKRERPPPRRLAEGGRMLLSIHIAAGGLAVVLGAVALVVKKGGTIHRRIGLLFVYSMLVLGATAALLGFRKSPTDGNVFGGLMTVYFAGTALITVRPVSARSRYYHVAALAVAVGLALVDVTGGVKAFNSPGGSLNGVPFVMHFFIAGVMVLAATGDARVIRFGVPRGGPRLARHLWRMCFALFIAAGSFFSIRERVAKILPEPFATAPMRALPILLVFGAMFYWLWRIRRRGGLPVILQHDSMPLTARAVRE
jgi:DNA-binding Xre family transcriptional regulator